MGRSPSCSISPLLERRLDDIQETLGRYRVIIYNNDTTPFEAVVRTLVEATKCSLEEAEIEAWEAHTFGSASVHFASEPDCHVVARVIESIGVRTEVRKEWDD